MNITSPLPATQFQLSVDTPSLIQEVANEQPNWIHRLILKTIETNLVPLSNHQVRELIVFLCPSEPPVQTPEVEWASHKIMQERLRTYTTSQASHRNTHRQDAQTLRALGLTSRSARRHSSRRNNRWIQTVTQRLSELLTKETWLTLQWNYINKDWSWSARRNAVGSNLSIRCWGYDRQIADKKRPEAN